LPPSYTEAATLCQREPHRATAAAVSPWCQGERCRRLVLRFKAAMPLPVGVLRDKMFGELDGWLLSVDRTWFRCMWLKGSREIAPGMSGTASGPRAATPGVRKAWPLGRLRRNSSLSARIRSGGGIHGLPRSGDWGGGRARAGENGPSRDGSGQVLTGPGFNNATAPACRTTFGSCG
jgi:hypothetical protein